MVSKHSLIWLLLIELTVPTARAQSGRDDYFVPEDVTVGGKGSEFLSGKGPDAVLMKVNVWGGVGKPGIHYIPRSTDLITLLAYAGGPTKDALLGDVTIQRKQKDQDSNIKVDVDTLFKDVKQNSPLLKPNDIVVVPESKPIIDKNTTSTLTLIGTLTTIVLSYFSISNASK